MVPFEGKARSEEGRKLLVRLDRWLSHDGQRETVRAKQDGLVLMDGQAGERKGSEDPCLFRGLWQR